MVQMLVAVTNIINVSASVLAGKLTPYVCKKHLILFSGLSFPIAGLLIFFYHPSILIMILFTALMGIGSGIRVTCVAALIYESFNEKESARLLGIQGAFISGGSMIFVWLGGQLARTHWENCYLVYLLCFVIFVIEAICLPKGSLDAKIPRGHASAPIPGKVWFLSCIGFIFGIMILTFNSNISMLITERSLGGTLEASYASIFYNFAGVIAGCVTGFVIRNLREHIFSCGLILAITGMLVCYLGSRLGLLCIGAILCGAAFSVFVPAGNYFAAHYASNHNRSFSIAVFNAGDSLGLFLSPIIISALFGNFTIPQKFLCAAISLCILLGIFNLGLIYGTRKKVLRKNHS